MATLVPTVIDGDLFTDDFTLRVRDAVTELQNPTTGTISPANANFTVDAPSTVLLLAEELVVASTSIRKVAGGALTPPGTIATIPAGFRPGATTEVAGVTLGTATPVLLDVTPGGDVQLTVLNGGGTFDAGAAVSFNATWRI